MNDWKVVVRPDPSHYQTYTPEQRRRHALRRELHDLMAAPHYRFRIDGDRLMVGPAECLTDEARAFIRQHKEDLMTHIAWLGEAVAR